MNNNNNRWLTFLTLLLLTANIVTLTLLWSNHKGKDRDEHKMPPPGEQVFDFVNHELNLDSTQREAYKKLREEHQAVQRPMHDSIKKEKDEFFALLQQSNVTENMIQAHAKRIGDLEQQISINTFGHFQKLRGLCNAEQQKKFDTIIQDVLSRLGQQRRQGPPPGMMDKKGIMPPPPGMENGENRPPPPQ